MRVTHLRTAVLGQSGGSSSGRGGERDWSRNQPRVGVRTHPADRRYCSLKAGFGTKTGPECRKTSWNLYALRLDSWPGWARQENGVKCIGSLLPSCV
jgi:hypothetical protein